MAQRAELSRQESLLIAQQDKRLDMRPREDIDQNTHADKQMRLRYRLASINLQLGALDHSHDDVAGLGPRVFERSQNVTQKWPGADFFENAQSSTSRF